MNKDVVLKILRCVLLENDNILTDINANRISYVRLE